MAAAIHDLNINPKPPDKSFAAALMGSSVDKLFSSITNNSSETLIPVKKPAMFKGEAAVFFSRTEIEKLASPFRFTLVGKFPAGRPSLEAVRRLFSALNLKSEFHIGLLDAKHILIRLENEIDYHRIWLKEQWSIYNFAMRVLKWTPNFDVTAECSIVPAWILLPLLPVHLFRRESLISIAQTVGKPLQVDASTATLLRPSVARICVEVDLTKSLPKRVWVGYENEDEGYWQAIQYEALPKYCKKCLRFGHEDKACGLTHQNDKGNLIAEAPFVGNKAPQNDKGKLIAEAPIVGNKAPQKQTEPQWIVVKHKKNQKTNANMPSTSKTNEERSLTLHEPIIKATKPQAEVSQNARSKTNEISENYNQEPGSKTHGQDLLNSVIIEEEGVTILEPVTKSTKSQTETSQISTPKTNEISEHNHKKSGSKTQRQDQPNLVTMEAEGDIEMVYDETTQHTANIHNRNLQNDVRVLAVQADHDQFLIDRLEVTGQDVRRSPRAKSPTCNEAESNIAPVIGNTSFPAGFCVPPGLGVPDREWGLLLDEEEAENQISRRRSDSFVSNRHSSSVEQTIRDAENLILGGHEEEEYWNAESLLLNEGSSTKMSKWQRKQARKKEKKNLPPPSSMILRSQDH